MGLRLHLEGQIMTTQVDDLIVQAKEQFAQAADAAALENAKARFLGKQGALTAMLKGLGKLDPEAKRQEGARINQLKQQRSTTDDLREYQNRLNALRVFYSEVAAE